jgi:hypothetical protein
MRTIKIAFLSLAAAFGLTGVGAGLIAAGYQYGYSEVAYADPVAAVLDAGPGPGPAAPEGIEPTQPSILAGPPCVDRDGPGPAPCIASPLDNPRASLDTAAAAQKVGWPLLVLVLAFGLLSVLAKYIPWLDGGYRALASAGLLAALAAAANASFAGGSYYAMASAAAGAVLMALQGNRTVVAQVKQAKAVA